MAITRNLDGFANVAADDPLRGLNFLDPTAWATYFEDFIIYDKTQGNAAYTLTQTNGVDTVAGPTGTLSLTLAGGDNDLAQLYLTDAPFATVAGKKLVLECRCKVQIGGGGVLGQEEWVIGLTSVQTGTNFMAADGLSRTFDDGLAFISYDGNANFTCLQGENDVFSQEVDAAAYADDTWMVLTIYYDGARAFFYKDGALIATLTANEPTSVITPMMFIKAGEAVAKVLIVDYLFIATER